MLAERAYHEGECVPHAYRHHGEHDGDQKVGQPIAGVCFLGPSSHHAEPPVYRQVDGGSQREKRRRRLQDRAEPAVNSQIDDQDNGYQQRRRLRDLQRFSKADRTLLTGRQTRARWARYVCSSGDPPRDSFRAMTRATRGPSISSTRSRWPSRLTSSPTLGMRPRPPKTRPPMVSKSSLSNWEPRVSFMSPIEALPSIE